MIIERIKFICDTLCDLVPFVQFYKREKHPWRGVTFSNVAGFLAGNFTRSKNTTMGCFSRSLNCANGTKSCNATHNLEENICDNPLEN